MAAGQPIKVGALGRNLMPTALDRREESLLLLNLAVKCQKFGNSLAPSTGVAKRIC